MKLSRRNFLKLGAATTTVLSLESKFSTLKALDKKLQESAKSVSLSGKELKAIPGTCLMCGVTDGILGYVEDGRLVKIEGNPKHPNTRGRICAKSQAGIQYLYDPYRIKYPMLRVGERGENKWKRISRDEALDIIAEKIKEAQKKKEPGRIAIHSGRDRDKTIRKRFLNAIGTKHSFNHTSICESSLKTGLASIFGADIDMSDTINSKYIMSFGENILEACYMHVPMSQRLMEARVNGTKLVVFDPRLTNTAAQADEWHPLTPGSDGAVILAMCHVIAKNKGHWTVRAKKFISEWGNYDYDKLVKHLEQFTPEWAEKISGISGKDIERIALEFAEKSPTCYARGYNGLSNNVNGAINAKNLVLLNALVGNIEEEGGFCLPKGGDVGEPKPKPSDPEGEFPLYEADHEAYPVAFEHAFHMLPEYIEESGYKLDLYMIHMYNPIFSNPDEIKWRKTLMDKGKIGFIVDFSPFWSETATEVADLIIPDVTYLERLAVSTMPSVEQMPFVQLYQPIVEPLYESSSIYENYFEIARRVGGETAKYFKFKSLEDYEKQVVESEWGEGSWNLLKKDGVLIKTMEGKAYKSFDQLTEEEKASLRKYNTYSKEIKPEDLAEMKEKKYQFPAGDGPILDEKGKKTKGLVKNGKFYKGFGTESGLFNIASKKWKEHGFPELPDYIPAKPVQKKADDELILITGKINVHTQSRTANVAWLMELAGYNPAWMNPKTAKKRGISEGDEIVVESGKAAKKVKCRVHLTEGINPDCIYLSASLGHWEYGGLASKGTIDDNGIKRSLFDTKLGFPADDLDKGYSRGTGSKGRIYPAPISKGSPVNQGNFQAQQVDPVTKNFAGKTTVGYSPNPIMEASKKYTDPIGGEYAWSNTLVKVRKA